MDVISDQLLALLQEQAKANGQSSNDYLQSLLQRAKSPPTLAENTARLIVEKNPNAFALFSEERGLFYVNEASCRLLGYDQDELQAMTVEELAQFVHPEDLPQIMDIIQEQVQAGLNVELLEYRLRRRDGSSTWVETRCTPFHIDDSEDLQILCVVHDISERKKATQEHAKSKQTLQAIFEKAQDAILLANDEATYIDANPAACELLGYSRDELLGKTVLDITPERYRDVGMGAWDEFTAEGELSGEYALLRKDNTEVVVEFIAVHDILPGVHLSLLRDITERVKLEESLRTSETRLRSLLDTQTAYVVRTNLQGDFTYTNQRYMDDYGWLFPDGDLKQRKVAETIVPEDLPAMSQAGQACLMTPGVPVQVVLRKPRQDGTTRATLWEFVALQDPGGKINEVQCMGFDVTDLQEAQEQLKLQNMALETAANGIVITDRDGYIEWVNPAFTHLTGYVDSDVIGKPIGDLQRTGAQDAAFYEDLWQTILSGKAWTGILINRRKDGSFYTEEQTIAPVTGANEEITHFIAIKQDVTERERSAQLKLDYERVKARFAKEREQNALIQRIISALSHDLRTPLAVIQTAKDKLEYYFDRFSEEQRREILQSIERQVQFTVSLLNDTVQLARGKLLEVEFNPQVINLAVLCQVSVDEICTTTDIHELIFDNQADLQFASVDELLVSRILLNLLSNAIKYSPDGGEIRLELDQVAEWLVLRVRDQGVGIPKEELETIFEPFYRSNAVKSANGTGLGLSIVKDCVERHQGRIRVESIVGKGSTFIVELPNVSVDMGDQNDHKTVYS